VESANGTFEPTVGENYDIQEQNGAWCDLLRPRETEGEAHSHYEEGWVSRVARTEFLDNHINRRDGCSEPDRIRVALKGGVKLHCLSRGCKNILVTFLDSH
jgi:hypothetical protein